MTADHETYCCVGFLGVFCCPLISVALIPLVNPPLQRRVVNVPVNSDALQQVTLALPFPNSKLFHLEIVLLPRLKHLIVPLKEALPHSL